MNQKTIRWILLVPGTIVISLIVPPIYEFAMSIVIKFIDVPYYPRGQFLNGFVFVMAAVIAPSHVFKVALVNASISIMGCFYFLFGNSYGESTVDLILSILGSLFALFLIYNVDKEFEK